MYAGRRTRTRTLTLTLVLVLVLVLILILILLLILIFFLAKQLRSQCFRREMMTLDDTCAQYAKTFPIQTSNT